jgi:hypothetical protein
MGQAAAGAREWRKSNPAKVVQGMVWLVVSWLILGGLV